MGLLAEFLQHRGNAGGKALILCQCVFITTENVGQSSPRCRGDRRLGLCQQFLYLMGMENRTLTLGEIDQSAVNQHCTSKQKTDSDDKGNCGFEAARHSRLAASRYSPRRLRPAAVKSPLSIGL